MLITSSIAWCQDPVFSQFYAAPLLLNPGLAGVSGGTSVALNYRNQWPALQRAYQSYAISFDHYFDRASSGVGAYILADNAGAGILKTTKVAAVYAYRLRINRDWQIRWAIEAGVVQARLNWDKLVFGDQIDPVLGPVSPGGTPLPGSEIPPEDFDLLYPDLTTGGILYNKNFHFGISLKHLNTPRQSYLGVNENLSGGLPMRVTLHGGAEIGFRVGNKRRYDTFISPGILYVRQGPLQQLNIGTFLGVGSFYGGMWYRHSGRNADAVIGAIGMRKDFLRITYSYDVTVSSLANRSGGSHEIGIQINLSEGQAESPLNDCLNLFR